MKYLCFGYYDKGKFDAMSESERNAMFDACFDYDDHLRASGHWAGSLLYRNLWGAMRVGRRIAQA